LSIKLNQKSEQEREERFSTQPLQQTPNPNFLFPSDLQ
jgi:hypothetical protein